MKKYKTYKPHRTIQRAQAVAGGTLIFLAAVSVFVAIGFIAGSGTKDARIAKIETVIVKAATVLPPRKPAPPKYYLPEDMAALVASIKLTNALKTRN